MANLRRDRGAIEASTAAGGAFAFFIAITPGLTGSQRRDLFARLPVELQDACWDSLARALEAQRW